ncbi:MAG TPA: tetratricopeptide repeat protein [Flavobacteriaceae bacterium]|nr:tetratricopeptide repeat protein [Flavobacteriaceae bacterium]MCB9214136.1 tetratricopeptide repeat protein [Alteromonas sp.]HPF11961.1 tetratricopeptide repeat protein [Flavobacteriaceae bacterium]HQU22064.1 tetratricopeptide repeat protein [Flavobacteriaceae bacterium]HQU65407.1 tetratricopeptide repeat protein [Flavobacteriaceae bacterium]
MDHLTKLEELLDQANLDIKDGLYDEATNKLEKILDMDPNFGKAYNHLGYLYEVKFKDYEKGETLYKLCLEKSPLYPSVYYNYAILLSTLGKWDDLKELLDQSLNVPGITKSTIYNEYAIMYEQQGKLDQAIEYYRKAALDTLDKNVLDRAKTSIERCKMKKDLM